MIIITAGTRIHCCDQHHAGGECYASHGAGNGYVLIFQRLTQDLQHIAVKFRQFIQEQHPAVRQADLAGGRVRAAPQQTGIRDRVVRRTEGAPPDQRAARA